MHQRDGSLALYVQNEVPESKKRANWILALAGPFFMAGCFYGTEASLTPATAVAWPKGLVLM